jgi:twitching motility two-component system response regulator PilG
LLQRTPNPHTEQAIHCSVLAVDDNAISRQAVTTAISKVGLKPVVVGNAGVALQLLRANDFALAILDVQLPDMDGFELCATLRSLPRHQQTPVVFVTILDGFADRVRSIVSGGNDFIHKPFPLVELGVKALVHIMNRRITSGTPSSKSVPAPASML